jgi:nicotinamide-nucleotide amidase
MSAAEAAGARAGIVVTGTEVLTGRVTDRNGPWLSDRLRELGVDLAHIMIVGDRREDMLAALRFLAGEGVDVIVTSGGLGPTADDLTAEVVGGFQGREMALDAALEERIAEILRPMAKRWPNLDMEAIRASNRKQAVVPAGSTVLDPVGTAPGLVVPPPDGESGPTVVVLPGPPRELQPMWSAAAATPALRAAIAGATEYRQTMLRLFGIPESEIAETLRAAEREGVDLDALEITTCLRRGEIEVVTRFQPHAQDTWEELERIVRERHADTLFSDDGRSVDQQVADLLRSGGDDGGGGAGLTIATAESCTGGLVAARLTELAGSSDYFVGGIVAYSNEAKVAVAGVPAELIELHGAVSGPVAEALADGAIARLGADVGVGVTGVAGPGGGTEDKPVGLVWFSVARRDGGRLTRSVRLPGGRADVRDRSTTVAMHLVRRALLGQTDDDRLSVVPAPEGTLRPDQ